MLGKRGWESPKDIPGISSTKIVLGSILGVFPMISAKEMSSVYFHSKSFPFSVPDTSKIEFRGAMGKGFLSFVGVLKSNSYKVDSRSKAEMAGGASRLFIVVSISYNWIYIVSAAFFLVKIRYLKSILSSPIRKYENCFAHSLPPHPTGRGLGVGRLPQGRNDWLLVFETISAVLDGSPIIL